MQPSRSASWANGPKKTQKAPASVTSATFGFADQLELLSALKKASNSHATLITSQNVPVPYLASSSAQMPRVAKTAERTSPQMRNWREVMRRMVFLIRSAR